MRRVRETSEERRQRLEKERPIRERQNEKRRKRRAEEAGSRVQFSEAVAEERRAEHARRVGEFESATREFTRRFVNNPFGYACSVCDRLWHKDKLTPVSEVMFPTLKLAYPEWDRETVASAVLCNTCKGSLRGQKIPLYSVSNGYTYPPMPEGLPRFNPVAERLLSPRIPFVQIRRLMNWKNGQYGIKGPIVNVPVDTDQMLKLLPRDVDDQQQILVNIKRRRIDRGVYLADEVTREQLLPWVEVLQNSPLYQHYDIKIDLEKVNNLIDVVQNNEVELEECDDGGDDPMSDAAALTMDQHTVMYDEDEALNRTVTMAPGEGQRPMSILYDTHAEELSFPQIYLGHARYIKPEAKPTITSMATSEIRRSDRRGALPMHVLYMAMKVIRHRVCDTLNAVFKNTQGVQKLTRGDVENPEKMENLIERDMGFMRGVPNTIQYWHTRKAELFAMIRQLGKPTAFLTLSASEMHWPRLLELLKRLKVSPSDFDVGEEEMNSYHAAVLVNEDPVVCAVYFEHMVRVIMQILCNKRISPFKPNHVLEYFKRIEFQHRGSAHAHILLWMADAPNEVVENGGMPETVALAERLLSVNNEALKRPRSQRHEHTHTCYKGSRKTCRFHFPLWPMPCTKVLTPLVLSHEDEDPEGTKRFEKLKAKRDALHEVLDGTVYESFEAMWEQHDIRDFEHYQMVIRSGLTRPTMMMKRDLDQCNTNAFNPWIAEMLNSNMDLQIILDVYACAAYVVEYVNKAARGVSSLGRAITKMLEEDESKMTYEQAMRKLGVHILNGIEMSAQEAAWMLLQFDMSQTSTDVIFVNTVWPEERVRTRKTKRQMDEEQLDTTSTDIWRKGVVEKYEERPPEMEDVTLAEFMTEYNINKLVKRRKTAILRCRDYDVNDVVNYKREHVMLYLPFRKENDFLDRNEFETIFDENKERIMEVKSKYNSAVTKAELLEYIRDINESVGIEDGCEGEREEEKGEDGVSPATLVVENDDTDIVPESTVTSVVVAANCPAVKKREGCMPLDEFHAKMRMTNHRQRMIIEEVIHGVTSEDAKPLRIFFTGPAGCGKTFTLRLIMDVYNRYCKSKKIGYGDGEISGVNAYIACATTGKAAVALNGVTVHSAFKIVMSAGREDRSLSAADLNTFRTLFKGVRCIIIDEVSMLSSDLLRQVDRRLRQIRADRMREPFGGFDVILCGDMRQLPPVRASEVYKRPRASGAVFSTDVIPWHHLEYFPLTQVVRQSDVVFSNLLTKIGDGAVLEDFEVDLIESRFVDAEGAALCSDAVRLYYSNGEVDAYNEKIANRCEHKVEHAARDLITGYRTHEQKELAKRALETFSRIETGNLPPMVVLCLEKPYMLLRNIDITDGLVNGMVGKLKLIEYDAQGEPSRVWLQCPPGVGILAKGKACPTCIQA
ncbi:uncharacterized protein [Dermacentor albipictus]|uniref:uncharacterized protein n=1 Tax=Dermacentor albipictus TaxID=60249 RepID=UPI0031FCEB84